METFKYAYKAHIGASLDNSDDESVVSSQSSSYESWKPLPYTDDEIKSNIAVVNPDLVDKTTFENSKNMKTRKSIQSQLDNQTLPLTCKICEVKCPSKAHALQHYVSKRHIARMEELNNKEKMGLVSSSQENQMGVAYCTVCELKIMNEEQYAVHFNSPPHVTPPQQDLSKCVKYSEILQNEGNLLKINHSWPNELKNLILDNYCHLCNTHVNTPEALQKHYKSSKHSNNAEVWLQNRSSFSKVEFNAEWPEELKYLILPNVCRLCDVNISSPSVVFSHYGCKKHKTKLYEWLQKNKRVQKNTTVKSAPPVQKCTSNKVQGYCYICNVNFDKYPNHVKSIMHCQLKNLVASIIRRGYPIQASCIKLFKQVVSENVCRLCNAQLTSQQTAISHFGGKSHIRQTEIWFLRNVQPSPQNTCDQIDAKWFFCGVCQKNLDGTSFAQSHYDNEHKKKQQYNCFTCNVLYSDLQQYEDHIRSVSHQKIVNTDNITVKQSNNTSSSICDKSFENTEQNTSLNTPGTSKDNQTCINLQNNSNQFNSTAADVSNISKTDNTDDIKRRCDDGDYKTGIFLQKQVSGNAKIQQNDESVEIQEELFSELKKFVNLIYFSKKIPLKTALTYLKRYNEEIDSLKSDFNADINLIDNSKQNVSQPDMMETEGNLHQNDGSKVPIRINDETSQCQSKFGFEKPSISDKEPTKIEEFQSNLELGIERTVDDSKEASFKCNPCGETFNDSEIKCHKDTHKEKKNDILNPQITEPDSIKATSQETCLLLSHHQPANDTTEEPNYAFQKAKNDEIFNDSLNRNKHPQTQVDNFIQKQKMLDCNDLILNLINNRTTDILEPTNEDFELDKQVVEELTKFIELVYNCGDLPLEVVLDCVQNFNKELEAFPAGNQTDTDISVDTKYDSETVTIKNPKLVYDQVKCKKSLEGKTENKNCTENESDKYNGKADLSHSVNTDCGDHPSDHPEHFLTGKIENLLEDTFECYYYDYDDENFQNYLQFREIYLSGLLNNNQISIPTSIEWLKLQEPVEISLVESINSTPDPPISANLELDTMSNIEFDDLESYSFELSNEPITNVNDDSNNFCELS